MGGRAREGLDCIRRKLSPLDHDLPRMHLLTSLAMLRSPGDAATKAGWPDSIAESRQRLVRAAEECISPAMVVPPRRLETLLSQALAYQAQSCKYHSAGDALNDLLSDHCCDKTSLAVTKRGANSQFALRRVEHNESSAGGAH